MGRAASQSGCHQCPAVPWREGAPERAVQDTCPAGCLAAAETGTTISEDFFFFSFPQPHFIIRANTPCLSFQPSVAQKPLARIESPVGWSLGRMGPCAARGTHVGCLASRRCPDELDWAHGKSIVSQQLLDQAAFCLWGASLVKPERQEVRQGPPGLAHQSQRSHINQHLPRLRAPVFMR